MKGVFLKLLYYSTLAGFFIGETRILGAWSSGIRQSSLKSSLIRIDKELIFVAQKVF